MASAGGISPQVVDHNMVGGRRAFIFDWKPEMRIEASGDS